jgi:hypothetical protein
MLAIRARQNIAVYSENGKKSATAQLASWDLSAIIVCV